MLTHVTALYLLVVYTAGTFFFIIDFYDFFFGVPGALSIPLYAGVTVLCVDRLKVLAHRSSVITISGERSTSQEKKILYEFKSLYYKQLGEFGEMRTKACQRGTRIVRNDGVSTV